MTISRLLFVALLAFPLSAATLPGFRVETIAQGPGFVSSLVVNGQGTIYFTTTDGWIHRVDGSTSSRITSLPTHAGGNGGLLGMALFDDHTAAVHYTTWNRVVGDYAKVLDDVISRVDLDTGVETVMHTLVCNVEFRPNGVSSEHHGGNPTIAPDGSVFLGIGDNGGRTRAQDPEWNAGKIWRIDPAGNASVFAFGMRNPYDLAWDPELERIVISDNGEHGGDEIHIVNEGDNGGWPPTPIIPGPTIEPVYVFPTTVAPTGLLRLGGENDMLRRGYLLGAFVSRALYYFPAVTGSVAHPLPLLEGFDEFVIDVTEGPDGEIYFATASFMGTSSIHRLHVPQRGDCNGDALVDGRDIGPLFREIADGDAAGAPQPMTTAQLGAYAGSWGCDANSDGIINDADLRALTGLLHGRRRAVAPR